MNNKESFKIYPEVPPLNLPPVKNNTEKNIELESKKILYDNIKLPEASYCKNNTILNMLIELNNKK